MLFVGNGWQMSTSGLGLNAHKTAIYAAEKLQSKIR